MTQRALSLSTPVFFINLNCIDIAILTGDEWKYWFIEMMCAKDIWNKHNLHTNNNKLFYSAHTVLCALYRQLNC